MPYAIVRNQKLHELGQLSASDGHVARTRDTPNANPAIPNITLLDSGTPNQPLAELVMDKIRSSHRKKLRSNAVLCVEFLLTASPTYFRPDDPAQYGHYDPQKLEAWVKANVEWMTQQYGDRIVRAVLHLDEATPHIHAYFVPLEPNGNLNCSYYFDGGYKMRQYQDQYHAALQHLGLERGIKGSKAKHEDVKDFYQVVNQGLDLDLVQAPLSVLKAKAAERDLAVLQKQQTAQTAQTLIQDNAALQAELLRYRSELDELATWKKQLVDTLRTIRLDRVAERLDLVQDPTHLSHWHFKDQVFTLTDTKFFNLNRQVGGGGAIDLVMTVNQCHYNQAVQWLRSEFGEEATLEIIKQSAAEQAENQAKTLFAEPGEPSFVPPVADDQQWMKVRQYLIQQLYLPDALIDRLHQQGKLYADAKQNAVFLRTRLGDQKITGANLVGTYGKGNQFAGVAPGTRLSQGCFQLRSGKGDKVSRIVLVESPLDAIAYQLLDQEKAEPAAGKTLYLSVDRCSQELLEHLKQAQEVVIAFQQDTQASDLKQRLLQQFPDAVEELPEHQSWSQDYSQNIEQFLQEMAQHREDLQRQQLIQARNQPTTGVHRACRTYRHFHEILQQSDPHSTLKDRDARIAMGLRTLEYQQEIVTAAIRIAGPGVYGAQSQDPEGWSQYGSQVAAHAFRELSPEEQVEWETRRKELEQLDRVAQAQKSRSQAKQLPSVQER